MEGLVSFLKEIYENCSVNFNIYVEGKIIFETNPDEEIEDSIESEVCIGKDKLTIQIAEEHEELLKLIKYCIKNKYKENYNHNEKIVIELLKSSIYDGEKIKELPFSEKNTYFICISTSQKSDEVIDILKNIYNNTDCMIIKYEDSILLIGEFEDIKEHVSSISDTINNSIYENSYISYNKINDYTNIRNIYKECLKKIKLGKKYRLSNTIYDENSLLFEKILDDMSEDTKQSLGRKFKQIFSQMDDDMIKTIETFFRLDLNLSESAKQLYVHRNTLIYRLDKIEKYTGYDIRKFNDACIFKIAFSIFQQKRNSLK